MSLQSLVLCSDDKIVRVLRRVLADLEIATDHCSDADGAIRKLTRQRFEAVVVDCTDEETASQVLRSARSAPCNKRAVAVAIVDAKTALRTAFEMGAHFVLYKPISAERARTSFRAARALMKRERRRNTRVPIEIPVTLRIMDGATQQAVTSDVGEGGVALQLPRRAQNLESMMVHFALPGTKHSVECMGEIAWENAGRQLGIRFVELSPECRSHLKAWLESHAPEMEKEDPPAQCRLTDLSPGGCYLEAPSLFPARTRVILSIRGVGQQIQAEGVVCVMHPEAGMGVEFRQRTAQQREHVKKFVHVLKDRSGILPDILVAPEGLETGESLTANPATAHAEDPLLDLFRQRAGLSTEEFLAELRRQRGSSPEAAETISV